MKTVVGLYQNFEDARQAVHTLVESGFSANNINMIASDQKGQYAQYLQGDPNQKQDISDGAAKGAGVGAVLGGLGGLLVGLGALAIPGIGPVIAAGPIAAALTGAGVGAVAGGVAGALVDLGIPEEHAKAYSEGIRKGGTLVAVQTDDQQASTAENILNRFNPVDLNRKEGMNMMGQSNVSGMEDRNLERQPTYSQTNVPVTGQDWTGNATATTRENLSPSERDMDQRFRNDYQTRYAAAGHDYYYYQPAYNYGYTLANDARYTGRDWSYVEQDARMEWERQHNASAWDEVKDAIRNGFEAVTRRL